MKFFANFGFNGHCDLLGNTGTFFTKSDMKYSSYRCVGRSMQVASNGKMILKQLCDLYLQYQHSRVLADELPSPLAVLHDYGGQYYPDKRIAIDIAPLIVLLLIVGGLFGYRQYHRYQIMTSEAGQAIKSFLDIVNKTSDEFPELKKPEPASPAPDDQTILKPFDNIEPIRED